MITVNCSQCKATLEMDDAFAGGVCRCHYCGTIQTVPAKAKRMPVGAAAAATKAPQAVTAARETSGLDALAQVVAGSGLSGAGMRSPAQSPGSAPQAEPTPVSYAAPPKQKTLTAPLAIALGVIVLLLFMVGWLMLGTATTTVITRGPRPVPVPGPGAPPGGDGSTPAPQPEGEAEAVPAGPNFCGIDLSGVPSVVYVLDRGRATADLFDALKEATYRSIESLKPGQKFQIIFWDNGDAPAAYPPDGLADASAREVEAARQQFADLVANGRTSLEGAVRRAAESRPGAIVVVTPKALELEDDLVKKVQAMVKGTSIKLHTIALRGNDGNTVLKTIADKTHGEFRIVSEKDLRRYSY